MKPRGDSDCELCHGRGYFDVPPNDQYPYGAVTRCGCLTRVLRRRSLEKMMASSGLSQATIQRWTFETFDPAAALADDRGRAQLATIKQYCEAFSASPSGWLVLSGPYGCGKSHLAYAIIARHCRAGHAVYACTVPDLLETLRQGYSHSGDKDSFDKRFALVRDAELVLLDDLGAENQTPWGNEKLYQILDYRHRQRVPLIITTNVNLYDSRGRIEPRALSRILDGANLPDGFSRVYLVAADDFRQRGPVTQAAARAG